MRLLREGQEIKTIRAYIDAEYSQYGPPTDTEPIQDAAQLSCSTPAANMCEDDTTGQAGTVNLDAWPEMAGPEAPSKTITHTGTSQ